MYILMSIHRSPLTCTLIAVEWISGIWTVGSWDIHILNLIWCWKIIYWDFQITVLVVYYFFFFFLSVQREIWPSHSPLVCKSKWLLKVCSSQISAKPHVFELHSCLESLGVGRVTIGVASSIMNSRLFLLPGLRALVCESWSAAVCRSVALGAAPLYCFFPSLEPAIILEMNNKQKLSSDQSFFLL